MVGEVRDRREEVPRRHQGVHAWSGFGFGFGLRFGFGFGFGLSPLAKCTGKAASLLSSEKYSSRTCMVQRRMGDFGPGCRKHYAPPLVCLSG